MIYDFYIYHCMRYYFGGISAFKYTFISNKNIFSSYLGGVLSTHTAKAFYCIPVRFSGHLCCAAPLRSVHR